MAFFNELLPKIFDISNAYTKNLNDELKAAFVRIAHFEEEFKRGKTTLQSINEDEDERTKTSDTESTKNRGGKTSVDVTSISSTESNSSKSQGASKKRTKNEVEDMHSPEQDKRPKRNASVRAQSNITKQVNVNLTQKLRREDTDKKEDDKENNPLLNIQIKQEKISLPPEPELMQMDSLPLEIVTKQEVISDNFAMPPPIAPVPKPRTKIPKEKLTEETNEEESTGRRRNTKTRKQTDTVPTRASTRSSRASSRATKQLVTEETMLPPPEPRPKRTRAKKKASEAENSEPDTETAATENGKASPAEKPRPKRTRRGRKASDKADQVSHGKPVEEPTVLPITEPKMEVSSPILKPTKVVNTAKGKNDLISKTIHSSIDSIDAVDNTRTMENINDMEKTRVISNLNDMDKTVVLQNGLYNHAPVTPKSVNNINETVVIDTIARETIVLEKKHNAIMDATVVLDKGPRQEDITDDNSLITDDSDTADMNTPPKQEPHQTQPTSAVKEKVQKFEELATRTTRTKTRAMAKKEEQTENQTPPDKIVKPVLSEETLKKMNSMIFGGKQISNSASKPRSNIPTSKPISASASKLSGINKAREEAEASKREKEDARKKKEAMLAAKRELHKRKREEKMAAAAAAREAAERDRQAAMEAAIKDKMEKQAHADLGKLERLKEVERKKQELARKVAETEERRRAEEQARQLRLAEEQRRADEARKKQQEEAAAGKKEAAIMAKEIEKRQKEYIEKQKMKQRMEDKNHTPLKTGGHGTALEPVYMADGFQYLNSDDEDSENSDMPVPDWSTSRNRRVQLYIQSQLSKVHVDRLFSVKVHRPDLRDIFPNIERAQLKRTSSAVWRTPPSRLPDLAE